MNSSAAAACLASSRARSRTRTFVSTARMATLHVAPDAFLQVSQGLRRRDFSKESTVDVLGAVMTGATHDDLAILLVPFEDRPGPDAQPLSNLGRHGDLPLRGQS